VLTQEERTGNLYTKGESLYVFELVRSIRSICSISPLVFWHSGRFELDIPFMYWIERGTEDVHIHLKYLTHRPV